jgi:4-amino-4-deoxy-L-arabinose transferase-like glycosyltransferase
MLLGVQASGFLLVTIRRAVFPGQFVARPSDDAGSVNTSQRSPTAEAPTSPRGRGDRRARKGLGFGARLSSTASKLASSLPLPLVSVLLVGLLLRLDAMDAYRPAVMTMADSTAYVWDAAGDLFGDPVRPAGYSIFLRGAHVVSSDLTFTIGLQHLLGLATAVVLYLIARRLGASTWLALVPAAVVSLSGDQVFLEHTLLSESTFTFLLCCAVYAAIRTLDGTQPILWGACAGLLIAAAATVRTAALVLVPVFALWSALCVPAPWRRKVIVGTATLVGGVAVLGLYSAFQNRSEGTWDLGRSSGWALYSRVAPFADCDQFTPPAGTRFLCEPTPPEQRPGPEYYGWVGGPARTRFGGPPNGDRLLERFAVSVVLHQPADYTKVVVKDTIRYFVPTFGFDRPSNGTGPELFAFDRRAPGYEEGIEQAVESYYGPFTLKLSPGGVRTLASYQEVVRVHGIIFLELLVLGMAGLLVTRGRQRRGLVLLLVAIGALLVVPAATTVYSARYGVPVEGLTAASAAVAGAAVLGRLRGSKRRNPEPLPNPRS